MPSPKSGTAGSLVSPASPTAVTDAGDASTGSAGTASGSGATPPAGAGSSSSVKAFKPDTDPNAPPKTGWIEVVLVDMDGKPFPGEAYSITLPDGSVASGTLDAKGFVRVEGFDPGACQVSFPKRDQEAVS